MFMYAMPYVMQKLEVGLNALGLAYEASEVYNLRHCIRQAVFGLYIHSIRQQRGLADIS